MPKATGRPRHTVAVGRSNERFGNKARSTEAMQTCGDLGWCDLGGLLNKISKTFCFPDILAYAARDLVNDHISFKTKQNKTQTWGSLHQTFRMAGVGHWE